jgi:hypothetical protein
MILCDFFVLSAGYIVFIPQVSLRSCTEKEAEKCREKVFLVPYIRHSIAHTVVHQKNRKTVTDSEATPKRWSRIERLSLTVHRHVLDLCPNLEQITSEHEYFLFKKNSKRRSHKNIKCAFIVNFIVLPIFFMIPLKPPLKVTPMYQVSI